jgi:hypothetical protein
LYSYAFDADDFVNDFVSLTNLVTKESLQALEASYKQSQGVSTGISFPQMQAAASRFLGRFWAGSGPHTSVKSINLNPKDANTPNNLRRSTSKQSMASTLNSVESTSDASTAPTEVSVDAQKSRTKSAISQNKDRDLHTQIEDLLMALSDLQRQQADLSRELQQEREDREEDQALSRSMLEFIKESPAADSAPAELLSKAEERFAAEDSNKHTSIDQTKHQLRDDLDRWKNMYSVETGRCLDLSRRMDDHEQENASLREQLREARGRIQDGYRDRQRLERTVRDLRNIKTPDTPPESYGSPTSEKGENTGGLRELKLARSASTKSSRKSTAFNKRSSSLGLQNVLATDNNRPPGDESLLLELVNAKTAEAVAKQELEEVKGKLDSLRKMVSGSSRGLGRPSTENRNSLLGLPPISKAPTEPPASSGGFFSGWGR